MVWADGRVAYRLQSSWRAGACTGAIGELALGWVA